MSRRYTAARHLGHVLGLLIERGSRRDLPKGERTIPRVVQAFNIITGHKLTKAQGWLFMCLVKAVRMSSGKYTPDDYDDHTGYSALMAEQARAEQPPRGRKPKD